MECREAQELISAYHDDELSADVRSLMAEHVQSCARCGEELAIFGQLSETAKGLSDPEPPQQMWAGIEAELDADGEGMPTALPASGKGRSPGKWRTSILTTAALLMIAIGLIWVISNTRHMPGRHGDLAADFEEYLEQFAKTPETAHNILLAKYDGKAVDLTQATRRLGYRPAVARLPAGYSLEKTYVLEMPCCTCVQSICRRDDGQVFAIIEHADEQPAWYGDRPKIETQCHGCSCSVMESDRGLVASWKSDERHFTVVGARDLEEIADLIGHFQGDTPDA